MRALAVAAVAALLLAGCSSSSSSSTSPGTTASQAATTSSPSTSGMGMGGGMVDVSVVDFAFQPAQATATVADGVHFTNHGKAAHTVTITDASGATVLDVTLQSGQAAHFAPPAAGSYHVRCRIHASMTMELTIQ